jgi:hypothetical protein
MDASESGAGGVCGHLSSLAPWLMLATLPPIVAPIDTISGMDRSIGVDNQLAVRA